MAFKRTVRLREFSVSRHQIWCAHAIAVQQMHACACKMPSCWSSACCCFIVFRRSQWVSLAIVFCNFSTKAQIRYARKTKLRGMIYFFSFNESFAGSLLASEIFTLWKRPQIAADHHATWPLCKLREHRFSVPGLVSPLPLPHSPA